MYEVQFHPADIRKQVRYFFLTARTIRWVMAGALALGLVLLAGMALAPLGVQSLLLESQLRLTNRTHELQREVLAQRRRRLEALKGQVEAARNLERQMALILGAPQGKTGAGGFPEELSDSIRVPEARAAVRLSRKLGTESSALLALAGELEGFAREHEDLTRIVPSICPLPVGSFVLTSPFGERVSPFTNARDFHSGIDLAAREGTQVYAAGNGRVVFAGRYPLRRNVRWWRYGNLVVLDHGRRYLTIYAHLQDVAVRRGQTVQRGETIGTVGNTGWSTSPHLHYEVRVREDNREPVPVDPRIFILNYQWRGHEALLAASRWAPPPDFDPLPSSFKR